MFKGALSLRAHRFVRKQISGEAWPPGHLAAGGRAAPEKSGEIGISSGESTLQAQDTHLSSTIISNRNIANYRLVELRGSGGMANIFKAIQLSLERPVALKIMHPHLITNEAFVARFEKEAKRAAMLQHENIVAIIDYGCDNGEYYIAMEYIDGTNLSEMLKKQKKMPLEICLHICHQVAEGLKYAHAAGIVHRDIKPANIMLSYDGRVMLTDFGIAKADGDLSITSTGQVIGSPSYMSPEQAAGKSLDHRSDIFSLGIILYEIIAGEKPFKGETYQSLIASIMSDTPASLRENRVDVTRELDQLVLKALSKSADSRHQSADEFSDAISAQLNKFKIPSLAKNDVGISKEPHQGDREAADREDHRPHGIGPVLPGRRRGETCRGQARIPGSAPVRQAQQGGQEVPLPPRFASGDSQGRGGGAFPAPGHDRQSGSGIGLLAASDWSYFRFLLSRRK